MQDLAVVILTYNEELHIARAIESVSSIASEIFVVDSHSSDDTVRIARALGAVVLQNEFINHARQFQWALDNAPLTARWVMRLDADEIIEADLAREIRDRLPSLAEDVAGINLKRRHIFLGRWIRHGGRYPLLLLRIWRRGQGRIEQRWMDEHMVVSGGRTITFDADFSDHNLNDLTYFIDKHNKYATREAIDVLNRKYALFGSDTIRSENTSLQASLKRMIKERLYGRLPYWLAAAGYFLLRYVVQLGFLDGKPGLAYHVLQGFWYRFLVGAKVEEYDVVLRALPDGASRLSALSRLTGHSLGDAAGPHRREMVEAQDGPPAHHVRGLALLERRETL